MHILLTRACATATQHSQSPCEPIAACWHHTIAQMLAHTCALTTACHTHVHARTCVCSHVRVQQPRSTHRALVSRQPPAGTTWLHRHLHTMAYHTRVHTCSVYVSVQQPCSTRSTHRAPESLLLPAGTTRLHRHLHTRVHSVQPVTHVCMHICVCAHMCVCNSHAALTEPL